MATEEVQDVQEQPVAKKWRKEYQPRDEDGAAIGKPQVFEADSEEELIDKLANAHMHATQAINRLTHSKKLMEAVNSDVEPQSLQRRDLTTDESFELSNAILDPAERQGAMKRIAAAEIGEPPENVRRRIEDSETRALLAEVELFKARHPEYLVCDENAQTLWSFLAKYRMKPSIENLETAYKELQKSGVELLRTDEPEPEPVRNTAEETDRGRITPLATTRPRAVSTGLRPGQSKPTAGPQKSKLTKAEIAGMSSDDYSLRMRDPEFRRMVDEVLTSRR